ncbi:MAG: hypothetical protein M1336_01505 [Deltaproteobacteria bacterium]|jgi:hypothetical protein|nr:hypothetical protein [Deltaproteobacteria bacterium]
MKRLWRRSCDAVLRRASISQAAACAALALALAGWALQGCSTMSSIGGPTPQQRRQNVETLLAAAGFRSLSAETSQQRQHLGNLPSGSLYYYTDSHGAQHYWFADPTYCQCMFYGDEAAYQRYEDLRLQNRLVEEQQQAQQANLAAQQMMMMGPMGMGVGPFMPFGFGFGPGMGFGF